MKRTGDRQETLTVFSEFIKEQIPYTTMSRLHDVDVHSTTLPTL